ncbi:MAG TPA: ATP-binding protein, partial [Candidatus Limnocylindrales bacterium]|nr:ATP-binding protein [Candidatus Limnocylindrales bacterium]
RSPTTAATASGAGIGLFVCDRLIRAMGGRIWARRRPEGGSEFGFALRAIADEDGAEDGAEDGTEARPQGEGSAVPGPVTSEAVVRS